MSSEDAINPKHYRGLVIDGHEIQCIDVIEVLDLGFHLGNALKYAWRFGRKPTSTLTRTEKQDERCTQLLEDAGKCEWYLARWRAQGYEHRVGFHANACLDSNAKRQLELSGHLRQMITFARDFASGKYTGPRFDPIPYMRELVDLLDIEATLIKHVTR